jgi:Tol biopolymer transport system component
MKNRFLQISLVLIISLLFIAIENITFSQEKYDASKDSLRYEGEVHIRNIRQLTFGGNNAEAYWSFDDKQLVFQSDWEKINSQGCDQIFVMNSDGTEIKNGEKYKLVSTNKGRTTCSYFLSDGRIIYASTHSADSKCPESAMISEGKYVWPLYDSYDIYVTDADGKNEKVLIGGKGYDAEATVSPDGRYVIFTSTRSGDLDLWRYDLQTGEYLQLTYELGYDGGAFFSRDSKQIVWRASRPIGEEAESYKQLLSEGLVEPKALNIFVADIDGKNARQITDLKGANWAPFFHPSGKKVLFCSNHHSIGNGGRRFDIFMINLDGTGIKQITNSGIFDAFPMFSNDGKKLVFCSNRRVDRKPTRETNVFIADWVENP